VRSQCEPLNEAALKADGLVWTSVGNAAAGRRAGGANADWSARLPTTNPPHHLRGDPSAGPRVARRIHALAITQSTAEMVGGRS